MAAYAASVSLRQRTPLPAGMGIGFVHGQIDITNYNSTLAEITGITGMFKGTPTVLLGGVSENGFGCRWVPASGSVKCFRFPTTLGAAVEAANDSDVGVVEFVAFGVIGR